MPTLTREKKTIMQLLIALSWADGHVTDEETEVIEALLDAFETPPDERKELQEWAATHRTLDDVDISNLEKSDLVLALQHGVLLSYIDGEQSDSERALIADLVRKLNFTAEEAGPLLESAEAFARSLLPELAT
ncbi:MAG: TerB family tellurite resistance protein [Myxococcales bacterium]|jgi:tellurite resistance protein|nr:TerB family tellurite resistance protein [Myxococcales bacterium]